MAKWPPGQCPVRGQMAVPHSERPHGGSFDLECAMFEAFRNTQPLRGAVGNSDQRLRAKTGLPAYTVAEDPVGTRADWPGERSEPASEQVVDEPARRAMSLGESEVPGHRRQQRQMWNSEGGHR